MTIRFTIYRCDKITPKAPTPQNEVQVGGEYVLAGLAMDDCNKMQRDDRKHTYTVGMA